MTAARCSCSVIFMPALPGRTFSRTTFLIFLAQSLGYRVGDTLSRWENSNLRPLVPQTSTLNQLSYTSVKRVAKILRDSVSPFFCKTQYLWTSKIHLSLSSRCDSNARVLLTPNQAGWPTPQLLVSVLGVGLEPTSVSRLPGLLRPSTLPICLSEHFVNTFPCLSCSENIHILLIKLVANL